VKPLRIALLVQTYLPDHVGGTEIYVKHLAEGLAKRGHEVAVVFHGRAQATLAGQTYETVALPPFRSSKRVHSFRRARGVSPPGFQEFLDRWKPDLAHFHSFAPEAGPDQARALTLSNIPYFFTYHMPPMTCIRGSLIRWGKEICDGRIEPKVCSACILEARGLPETVAKMIPPISLPWHALPEGPWLTRVSLPSLVSELGESWREFARGARHIVACAKWVSEVLIVNGVASEKITVLRQALPGSNRNRTLRLPCPTQRALRLGYFGRIAREKGVDLFLTAGNLLHSAGIPVINEIIGPFSDSQMESLVLQRAKEYPDRVKYLGTKHGVELGAWIQSIDLMVFPSRWLETGPLTVLESWDHGTPAIGTNLGGIREFFSQNGQASLLFEMEDPVSLSEAVKRALSWKGPAPSVEISGIEELVDQMETIYR